MPLVDDVTAPIDPEDVDETYAPAPDGGLKPRFDVPWYVYLAASRNASHGAGSYGLQVPWYRTSNAGETNEGKIFGEVQGKTLADKNITKGVLTPPELASGACVVGNFEYNNISMSDNNQSGLDELTIGSGRKGAPDAVIPGPLFPERALEMYLVPRAGGVDQTLSVGVDTVFATDSDSAWVTVDGEQGIGVAAYVRSKVKANGPYAYGRAEGLFFELVVTAPTGGFGGVPGQPLTFDKWRLVAVTDAQDATGGVQVLATSTVNLPTKVGERRAMTLRCKDGRAICYVDGAQIMDADVPATLLATEYTPPGPPLQGWFHAGAGNMYVGPHTYLKTPDGTITQTSYRGRVNWLADLYVCHKAGHLGTAWSSFPNNKPFPLPNGGPDADYVASLPASRLGQPPTILTTVPDGAPMGRMGVRALNNVYNMTMRTHWVAETPLPETGTTTYSPDLHAAFNAGSGDGLLMAMMPAEYNSPEMDDRYTVGLVVRGRVKGKTFLMVEVFNNGGVILPGSSPETRTHMVKLWAYKADGTRTLLKAGSVLPPMDYEYVSDAYTDSRSTFGYTGTSVYTSVQVHVKTVGSNVKVYLTPRAGGYGYLRRPTLILQHTLAGDDATTYGSDAPMVGFSTLRPYMSSVSAAPPMAFAYVTKDPVVIVPDPPQVVEPVDDTPVDVGPGDDTQVDTVIPPGGGTTIKNGPTDEGTDGGSEVTTTRDPDGTTKTTIVIKDPDGGPDVVITVPDWVDAKPGDPIRFRVQWVNGKIVIWFNGVIWFTYVLTAADLSKLGVSRKYLSFWSGGVRVIPPAGTVIIRGQWTPTSLTMMVVVPTVSLGAGASKDRLWGRFDTTGSQVLIVGSDESVVLTDEPDDELLAAATHVFGGGRATANVVSPEVANLIGAAGFGDLLHTIEN